VSGGRRRSVVTGEQSGYDSVCRPEENSDVTVTISMQTSEWARRIRRAGDLAGRHPSAAEVLNFYRHILEFQKDVYDDISVRPHAELDRGRPFREQLDVNAATRQLPDLLTLVEKTGPSKLASEATRLGHAGAEQQRKLMSDFVQEMGGTDSELHTFFPRVLFQPHAEHLAGATAAQLQGFSGPVCPVCQTRPQVAVLRPEGDGGKRFLVCSFCSTEWEFRRILCPMCGEQDHAKLPRYSSDDMHAVRVEACDTCQYYLKSVDMTADGLAVPVVDEVATAPLDVWAVEHGYKKISLNIMGF
jgi:FdhE protein